MPSRRRTPTRPKTAHRALDSQIDRAVLHGAFHKNNGARKKSRAARFAAAGLVVLARSGGCAVQREGERGLLVDRADLALAA